MILTDTALYADRVSRETAQGNAGATGSAVQQLDYG